MLLLLIFSTWAVLGAVVFAVWFMIVSAGLAISLVGLLVIVMLAALVVWRQMRRRTPAG